MPIITPAYPSMCATHNVTDSTRAIMINEFKQGTAIVEKVMAGTGKWSDLFVKSDFFHSYKYYLQIISSSDSADQQLTWSGLVEAKLRQLILKLELVDKVQLAHPYVKTIDKVHYCLDEKEKVDAANGIYNNDRSFTVEEGSLETNHMDLLKEKGIISEEQEKQVIRVYSTTFYIGLEVEPKIGRWFYIRHLIIQSVTNIE